MRPAAPRVYTIDDTLPSGEPIRFETPAGVAFLTPTSGDGDGIIRVADGSPIGHLDAAVRYRYEGASAAETVARGYVARDADGNTVGGEQPTQAAAIEALLRAR